MKKLSQKLLVLIMCLFSLTVAHAHVPHDIIYAVDISPNYANDGLVFSSSTQFGEMHLMSTNKGELFVESIAGMTRTLATGHTFSSKFTKDGVVYMTTREGYYKSSDRGESWDKQTHFADEEVISICLAPDYAKTKAIYVLTSKGVFFVENNGKKKTSIREIAEITVGKLMVADNTLYVLGVYHKHQNKKMGMEHIDYTSGTMNAYSIASGKWSSLSSQLANGIVVDYDIAQVGKQQHIIVSMKDGRILLSKDAGKSWNKVFTKKDDYICKLKFSPSYASDKVIAMGTAKGYMYMTNNAGADWKVKSNGLSRWVHHTNIQITKLKFSPDYKNDKTIFLGRTTGFYKTTDDGAYWRHVNVWNPKWGYYVLPAPGKATQDIFTATYNSGISRSHDNGDTWYSGNKGITSAFTNGMALSPNYKNDRTMFALDISTGLYRSSNAGSSWSTVKGFDAKKLYDLPVLHREFGISSHFDEDGVMFIFAVPRRTLGVKEKMVWKYNDITKEVKLVKLGTNSNYINCFSSTPKEVKNQSIFCGSSQGAFLSTDLGDTWTNVFDKSGIQAIFISPSFATDKMVYLMDVKGKIQVSHDGGRTFEFTELGLHGIYVNNLTFSPNFEHDKTLYVTTYGEGVLKSTDNGKSWKYFGLKGKFMYTGVSFSNDYKNDKTIFAPTVGGIYRSQDDGKSWTNVMNKIQFVAKFPYVSLLSPDGKEVDLTANTEKLMKQYKLYDEEICEDVLAKPSRDVVKKVMNTEAYLASYYKFKTKPGYRAEVYFCGTSVDYRCVTGSDMGIVEIEVDGKSYGEFDLYSKEETCDVSAIVVDGLANEFHTMKIISTGKKNKQSTGTSFTFNAANIGE